MFKNQLQELAQRSCFNLPAYACIREGPDHAPRFKATVNFNGETFESPSYCSTLRQAEHAAAEVALNVLSKRGPSQSLAARILDETGVCKNLLQETAQRAGVSLPVYTVIRSGPGHLPVFKCIVEVGGMTFIGEPAKTKKQAEKNAAMAALAALKQLTTQGVPASQPLLLESGLSNEQEENYPSGSDSGAQGRDDLERNTIASNGIQIQSSQSFMTQDPYRRPRVRVVNVRERSIRSEGSPASPFHPRSPASPASELVPFDASQNHRYALNQSQMSGTSRNTSPFRPMMHRRSHSSSSVATAEVPLLSREAVAASRAAGNNMGRVMPVHIRGLPMASRSERNDVRIPIEEHLRDEDEWLRGEPSKPNLGGDTSGYSGDTSGFSDGGRSSYNPMMWSRASQWWGSQPPTTSTTSRAPTITSTSAKSSRASAAAVAGSLGLRPPTSLAPPVRVRQMVAVCSAPPPRRPDPAPPRRLDPSRISELEARDSNEATTRESFSQLRL